MIAGLFATPLAAETTGPFANWAAVVVAGDYHASHSDQPTETFDNARRDVAAELVRKGFSAANIRQFSVRPERYPDTKPGKSDLQPIYDGLSELARRATGGCLIYFSSHGAPQGVVLDGDLLAPQMMDQMITDACGERPTVVIISACFSGVFIPALPSAAAPPTNIPTSTPACSRCCRARTISPSSVPRFRPVSPSASWTPAPRRRPSRKSGWGRRSGPSCR
jgi:hypothetical protein